MKNNLRNLLTSALVMVSSLAAAQQSALIPVPEKVTAGEGQWTVKKKTTIGYTDPQLQPAAEYLSLLLGKSTGYRFKTKSGRGDIQLSLSPDTTEGAYRLTVGCKGITLQGTDYKGVVNGIATLRQLLPADIESEKVVERTWTVPCVDINDRPRFEWRGMELDCSRHFFTTAEVKRLLDVLALYKIDKLHWHLTDDQGWRIEIKQYPKLTANGAWRIFNNQDSVCIRQAKEKDMPNLQLQTDKIRTDSEGHTVYGGYYTQQDIRDIVAYAQVRGIEIIPEIDMPGHSLMAIDNYDGLSCYKETGWGKDFSTPMCPGKDTMLQFCKNVWSELFALFPSKYVHIGGDEVDMKNWKTCPDCQKRMTDHGLKNEHELQAWFNHYMENFFTQNGKTMIGWDETIDGGLSSSQVVMWWRTWAPKAPKQTTGHGNPLICTPNEPFYLDYEEQAATIPNLYKYDPYKGLDAKERQLVLGVQGNLWTEWVPTFERMWYMAFPRMLAIAELGWSSETNKQIGDFQKRLAAHLPRLQQLGVTYRFPDLTGFSNTNVFTDKATVDVSCADTSALIRYTTDGSIPQLTSPLYTGVMTIDSTTHYAFRTFGKDGRKGETVRCSYVKEAYAPAATAEKLQEGLQVQWYDYDGPDCAGIDKVKLNGTYITDGVKIPAEAKGNIGLVITGYIEVPADDIYTFALKSDDGSYLMLDGNMTVDNDNEHSVREITGQHAMKKGIHPLYARYFDHNGGQLLLTVKDSRGKEVKVKYLH